MKDGSLISQDVTDPNKTIDTMQPKTNQPQGNPKKLKLAFTRQEAAETLGISTVSIDRLVKRGLLRPSLALRRPLFAVWELERFLRETSERIEL